MALRSLVSMLGRACSRMGVRARAPWTPDLGARGSAAERQTAEALLVLSGEEIPRDQRALAACYMHRTLRTTVANQGAFVVPGRAGSTVPRGARPLHSLVPNQGAFGVPGRAGSTVPRGARPLHSLRELAAEHTGVIIAVFLAASSVIVGPLVMKHTTETGDDSEEAAMETHAYYHLIQCKEDLERTVKSCSRDGKKASNAVTDREAVDQENPAMRVRFEDWMKEYGRKYKDEAEMAWRFEIFKATARFVDAANAYRAEQGSGASFALNDFADLSHEEQLRFYGERPDTD